MSEIEIEIEFEGGSTITVERRPKGVMIYAPDGRYYPSEAELAALIAALQSVQP